MVRGVLRRLRWHRPGIDPASTDDNGALQFINPNQLAGIFLDAGNRRIANPYDMGNQAFKLEAGQLVLFPSWLNHQVLPHQGDGERIAVAFNTWFAGLDRW
ncbi:MAG: putative 2OG-Fe(II) oxygenase [Xanthomonadaceae bacterium]|nr:putative 2OG-Fe(II) oxygenase [Xanthomonadaceae bacterium]